MQETKRLVLDLIGPYTPATGAPHASLANAAMVLAYTSGSPEVWGFLARHLGDGWISNTPPLTPWSVARAIPELFDPFPECNPWGFKQGARGATRLSFKDVFKRDPWKARFMLRLCRELSTEEDWEGETDQDLEPEINEALHYLQWLASDAKRLNYVDDAQTIYGPTDSVIHAIENGYEHEKLEVYLKLKEAILAFVEDYRRDGPR